MKNVEIKIFNDGVNELPAYNKANDAGFDFRADFSKIKRTEDLLGNVRYNFFPEEQSSNAKKSVILRPNGRVLIPTNNHVNIPEGYEIQARPRSGMALKHGITIVNAPGTIDSGFLGNIGIILLNTDDQYSFLIEDGDRIAQGVLTEISHCVWKQVNSIDELGETERGQSGYGDSGNK